MLKRVGRVFHWSVVIGALFLVACGGGETTIVVDKETDLPAATSAPTPTEQQEVTTEETPALVEPCEAPATEMVLGSPVSSEIIGFDQPPGERIYFCVQVPDGITKIMFELTEMTSDLNMYVGHPDLETVQNGGIWFWYTDERGIEDKVVVVEPALTDYVNVGPYYIEVSA
jgi:hypothetical protein